MLWMGKRHRSPRVYTFTAVQDFSSTISGPCVWSSCLIGSRSPDTAALLHNHVSFFGRTWGRGQPSGIRSAALSGIPRQHIFWYNPTFVYSDRCGFFRKIPYIEKIDCAEPVIIHILAVDFWKIRKFAEELKT